MKNKKLIIILALALVAGFSYYFIISENNVKTKNDVEVSNITYSGNTIVEEKDGKKVIYIANFSSKPINSKVAIKGDFTNYMTGKPMSLKDNEVITLQPFQYFILNN